MPHDERAYPSTARVVARTKTPADAAGEGAPVSRVPRRSTTRGRGGVAAVGVASLILTPLVAVTPAAALMSTGPVFISEIHYDNAGTDVGEAIEVQAPVGTDLSGWQIVLYNGSNNTAYGPRTLSGVVGDSGVLVQVSDGKCQLIGIVPGLV